MKNRRTWKRHESEVAALMGGKRQPCTGGHHADVLTPCFAVECKARTRLPEWLKDAMAQAVRSATEGRTPLVVLTEVQQGRRAERFVLIRMADWLDWHGGNIPATTNIRQESNPGAITGHCGEEADK